MLNSPLIEVDAKRKINEIQEKYIEIKKGMDKLTEINNAQDNKLISELEGYKRLKQLLKKDFDFLDEVIEEFNNNLEEDNQTYYSTKTQKEIKDVLNKIDMNKLRTQKEEYKKIIDKIDKRMYRYISYEEQQKTEKENEKCKKRKYGIKRKNKRK